jgi:nicotinamidase/pyrazinamidase
VDALIVIDMQRDFVDPDGALYFAGAEKVVAPAIDVIKNSMERSEIVITTQDWHEANDEEFKMWPSHCIKNTPGAELIAPLRELLQNYPKYYPVYKTRYSAFYGTELDRILKNFSIDKVQVCGVVTHICVLFTVEELRNRNIKVEVYEKATASYDREFHEFALRMMKEVLGAEVIL